MPGKHALLSPSGASKWIKCTKAPRLEEGFPESQSEYADEGTLAHSISELFIRNKLVGAKAAYHNTHFAKLRANKHYSVSMAAYCDTYADYVIERFNAAKAIDPNAMIFLETKFDLSKWIPEGYGTGDVFILCFLYGEFIDLKYGQGVPVSAKDNSQLRIYALGAMETYGWIVKPPSVTVTIVQPRLDSITSESLPVSELYIWGETVLKPAAKKAWDNDGQFLAGKHCQFCRAKSLCRARHDANIQIAQQDFQTGDEVKPVTKLPELLTQPEIARIVLLSSQLSDWLKAVNDYALDRALKGTKFEGLKIVRGRANRYITDEAKAMQLLADMFIPESEYTKPLELRTLGELEYVLGKKQFEIRMKGLVQKPEGKPALVSESDPREAINSVSQAQKDFEGY